MKAFSVLVSLLVVLTGPLAFAAKEAPTAGELAKYKELVAYFDSVGWDKVHYASNTQVAMIFIKGTVKDLSTGTVKNAIFYYWKSYALPTDSSGNVLVDEASQSKALDSCCGPDPARDVEDVFSDNLIFDMKLINADVIAPADRYKGFRVLVYEDENTVASTIGQVNALSDGINAVMYPFTLSFRWLNNNAGAHQGLLVESEATGLHKLLDLYPIKNYDKSFTGVQLPLIVGDE